MPWQPGWPFWPLPPYPPSTQPPTHPTSPPAPTTSPQPSIAHLDELGDGRAEELRQRGRVADAGVGRDRRLQLAALRGRRCQECVQQQRQPVLGHARQHAQVPAPQDELDGQYVRGMRVWYDCKPASSAAAAPRVLHPARLVGYSLLGHLWRVGGGGVHVHVLLLWPRLVVPHVGGVGIPHLSARG